MADLELVPSIKRAAASLKLVLKSGCDLLPLLNVQGRCINVGMKSSTRILDDFNRRFIRVGAADGKQRCRRWYAHLWAED
jgi:hypothetical protein